jgi:hypothetical protein
MLKNNRRTCFLLTINRASIIFALRARNYLSMLKTILVKLRAAALLFCCLFCFGAAMGQTVTITSANSIATNGITSGNIIVGQTNVVLFGFTVQVTGSETFTAFTLDGNSNSIAGLFANGRLYRNTTGVTFAGAQIVNGASVSIVNRDPAITGISQTITNATYTYFVVADLSPSYGSLPNTVQYSFDKANYNN